MSMVELFPDTEQRAVRRVELHARIDHFLNNFVSAKEDGWPIVLRDDLVELHDIVGEIIDLKFERDTDGDAPVIPLFDDRTEGTMTFATIPHAPDEIGGDEAVEWYSRMSQAINTLTTGALSATNILASRLQRDASKRRDEKLAEDWIKGAREHLANGELEQAEKLMRAVYGEGGPERLGGKHVLLAKDDPRVEALRVEMCKYYDLRQPTLTVNRAIDAMEAADLSDRKVEQECFSILREAYEKYSRFAFAGEIDRANRIAEERRLARKVKIG